MAPHAVLLGIGGYSKAASYMCPWKACLVSCRLPLCYRHMGPLTEDHKRQIAVLHENDADLDWVAVCPPYISGSAFTGNYEVTVNEKNSCRCSKYHIADLMVKCLKDDSYLGKTIACGDTQGCTIL